jgi:hypothetical protein
MLFIESINFSFDIGYFSRPDNISFNLLIEPYIF